MRFVSSRPKARRWSLSSPLCAFNARYRSSQRQLLASVLSFGALRAETRGHRYQLFAGFLMNYCEIILLPPK